MNSMMPISHRLFAAAVADGAESRKPKPRVEKPVIIEVDQKGVRTAWTNGQPKPTHRSISSEVWLDGEQR
jgi:hypothetical protein